MKCIICESTKIFCRGYCNKCYNNGLKSGTILRIVKPELPSFLTNIQDDLIIGSMLGDGNLTLAKHAANAKFNIGRAQKDLSYLEWEYDIIKDFCLSGIRYKTFFDDRYDKWYHNVSFSTRNSPIFTNYFNNWYPNGKKIVPKDLVLSSMNLAIWFCDDGCITHAYKPYKLVLALYTNGFNKNDVEFLISLLEQRYNEKFLLSFDKNNPIIKAGDNATRAFLKEIDGYMPSSMLRKAEKWRGDENRFYSNIPGRATSLLKNRMGKLSGIEIEILNFILLNKKIVAKDLFSELRIKRSNICLYLKKFSDLEYLLIEKRGPKQGGYIYSLSDKGLEILQKSK